MNKKQIVILAFIGLFLIRMAMEMRPGQFVMVLAPMLLVSYLIARKKGVFDKDDLELD